MAHESYSVTVSLVTEWHSETAKTWALDSHGSRFLFLRKCDICQIGVTDNQFATEIILENGKALKFDDIGCMYKWMEINSDEKTKEKFVRDYDSKDWISLEDATYVYDKTITTPMAYNVISFKNKKDAESFVSNYKGKVLSYKELAEHKWEMNKEMMGNTKKGNQGGHH